MEADIEREEKVRRKKRKIEKGRDMNGIEGIEEKTS